MIGPPDERFRAKRWLAWGIPLFVVGLPLFLIGPKPEAVFAESDVSPGSQWLKVLPTLFGVACAFGGLMFSLLGLLVLAGSGSKRKPCPYAVDESGIRLGSKSLAWNQVKRVHRMGVADTQLVLEPFSGPNWQIHCRLYSNGMDLRDAILSHSPERDLRSVSGGTLKALTGQAWLLSVFALAFAVLAIGILFFGWKLNSSGDSTAFGATCGVLALMLVPIPAASLYRVDVDDQGVRLRYAIGPKRFIPFTDIEHVDIKALRSKGGPFETTEVSAGHKRIRFSSNVAEYGDLRDAILMRVDTKLVRRS